LVLASCVHHVGYGFFLLVSYQTNHAFHKKCSTSGSLSRSIIEVKEISNAAFSPRNAQCRHFSVLTKSYTDIVKNKHCITIIRGVLTYPCKRRNLEWLCIPIVEPFQVELVLKPGGWRSNFCIARHEPVANNASFPIAFCARFRSYICMRPYFNLSVRQSKSDSKMG